MERSLSLGSKRAEIKIKAELENLSTIADFIEKTMKEFGIPEHIFAVQTAVDEACSNVMLYGYPDGAGDITIDCEAENGVLTITIKDKGIPFDPGRVPPTRPGVGPGTPAYRRTGYIFPEDINGRGGLQL